MYYNWNLLGYNETHDRHFDECIVLPVQCVSLSFSHSFIKYMQKFYPTCFLFWFEKLKLWCALSLWGYAIF